MKCNPILLLFLSLSAVPCFSETPATSAGKSAAAQETEKDVFMLGNIKLFARTKTILIPAHAAIDSGILEYLAVTPDGKAYESVMALQCDAASFHAALLLINAKPGQVTWSGNPKVPPSINGDTLALDIVYMENGKEMVISALDLLEFRDSTLARDEKVNKAKINWIFTGSREIDPRGSSKKGFGPGMPGSLVAIVTDEAADINFSVTTTNPYRGETAGFRVKRSLAAKIGKDYFLRITKQTSAKK